MVELIEKVEVGETEGKEGKELLDLIVSRASGIDIVAITLSPNSCDSSCVSVPCVKCMNNVYANGREDKPADYGVNREYQL